MGFFAAELETVLKDHNLHERANYWSILTRMGVHPQQIDRLKKAAEDAASVASLQTSHLDQLCRENDLTHAERCRLIAGVDADTILRLLLYHNYPLEEALNKANAIFAASLKDHLASSDPHAIYVRVEGISLPPPVKKRGYRKRVKDTLTGA